MAPDLTYRPGRPGLAKLLGELEGRVMELVWREGGATVREVHDALARDKAGLAYTTVMTVMSRLAAKGLLRRERIGNAFRYRPTETRDEFVARASKEIFAGLARDLSGPALSAFVESLGPEESAALAELGRLVEARRRPRAGAKAARKPKGRS